MLPGLAPLMVGAASAASGSLSATISTTYISKTGTTRGGSRTLISASVTVTPSGGAGGYTHSWVRISGDSAITAATPSAASTKFSGTVSPDDEKTAVFEDTVTDAVGFVVKKQVTVALYLVFADIGGTL